MITTKGKNLSSKQHRKTVLFYRDFQEYTGGHQKVADYFSHLQSTTEFTVDIAFSKATRWDSSNPWFPAYQDKAGDYFPAKYDYAFLAGVDWQVYVASERKPNQPIVNFIQHVRHADPAQPMHRFLSEKAVRICVSQEVADAIKATGLVNGPLFTINNGIAIPAIEASHKQYDVFIFGPKNPELARELEAELTQQGINAFVINHWLPREQLLGALAASRVAVLLPGKTEGFYLPALESMRYADLTVVPDCVGNRSFCHDRQNCLFPAYNTPALVAAVQDGLALVQQPDQLNIFKRNCVDTLAYHSLERERTEFLDLMRQLDSIWQSM